MVSVVVPVPGLGKVLGGLAGEIVVYGILILVLGAVLLPFSSGYFGSLIFYLALPMLLIGIFVLILGIIMMYLKFLKLKVEARKTGTDQPLPKKSFTPHSGVTEWSPQVDCAEFNTREDAKQFFTTEGPVKICQNRKTCASFDAKTCFAKEVKPKA